MGPTFACAGSRWEAGTVAPLSAGSRCASRSCGAGRRQHEATIRGVRIPARERHRIPPREKVGPMLIVPRAAALAALALCLAAPAAAQTAPAPSASPSPLPDIGRVITSDRHEEPLASTTRPTFVVDRAAIEARGDRSVADALSGVPGVALYRYGAFGAQASVFIRGTNG